jgi:hypothetical protein
MILSLLLSFQYISKKENRKNPFLKKRMILFLLLSFQYISKKENRKNPFLKK